jgi:hypothetical protein
MQNKPKNANDETIWSALKEGWVNIDAHAWPGMIMFLALIAIEASVNVIVSIPAFGLGISIGVGLLFGVFLGMWHIISERPFNSIKQQSVVEFLVYEISALSIFLIVVNLLRVDGELTLSTSILPTASHLHGWDYIAIVIIGTAFASHLLGYLTWHKADSRRASLQTYNRRLATVKDAEKDAELASQRAEVQCKALTAALGKEAELRANYGNLPKDKLDRIIRDAVAEVYAAFEKTYNMDLDNSGKIGDKPKDNHAPAPVMTPARVFPEQTDLVKDRKNGDGENRPS